MADSRGADSVDEPSSQAFDRERCETPAPSEAASPPIACPECANPRQVLVSQGDVVSIYRCPVCGHLSAPVRKG